MIFNRLLEKEIEKRSVFWVFVSVYIVFFRNVQVLAIGSKVRFLSIFQTNVFARFTSWSVEPKSDVSSCVFYDWVAKRSYLFFRNYYVSRFVNRLWFWLPLFWLSWETDADGFPTVRWAKAVLLATTFWITAWAKRSCASAIKIYSILRTWNRRRDFLQVEFVLLASYGNIVSVLVLGAILWLLAVFGLAAFIALARTLLFGRSFKEIKVTKIKIH